MVMQRWDPFRELQRMEETMNRIWRGVAPAIEGLGTERWGIPLDVVEEGENLVVHASLPGMNPEDIQVSVEEDVLIIKGQSSSRREVQESNYLMRERRGGSFFRTLRLPDSVDQDKAKSVYKNGVLSITFPKLAGKKSKQLKIEVQDQDETSEEPKQ